MYILGIVVVALPVSFHVDKTCCFLHKQTGGHSLIVIPKNCNCSQLRNGTVEFITGHNCDKLADRLQTVGTKSVLLLDLLPYTSFLLVLQVPVKCHEL